jgi:NAD(P)-dependent dehydrogenase (short-subunit alcohol dehydrogenase family)
MTLRGKRIVVLGGSSSIGLATAHAADRTALYRQTAEKLPVGHVGETEEIAQAYLYLMRQTYGSGHVLTVDGGGALI